MTEYLHPSVASKITDNSFVFQTAQGATALFQAFRSAKGEDNVLKLQTTPEEFLFNYGTPNLSKYGQGGYNVLEWLKAGGMAYTMRVLPTNATFAAVGLSIVIGTGADVIYAAPVLNTTHAFTSVNAAKTFLANESVTEAKSEIPLAVFYPKGRGAAYNDLGVNISIKDNLDNTYAFRTYDFEVTAKDALGQPVVVEGPFTIAFDPEAVNLNRESVYFVNVINKYSKFMRVVARETAFDEITEELITRGGFTLGEDESPSNLDILYGTTAANRKGDQDGIEWFTADSLVASIPSELTGSVFLDPTTATTLINGSDGTWTEGNSEESLLVKAYTGILDPSVTDKLAYEIDVLLDANNPLPVKEAMHQLASVIRQDCVALLDVGFQADAVQTLAARSNDITMSSFYTSIFAHDMNVYDAYNGLDIKVTTPYILAGRIPTIDVAYGIQYPFVGPRRGVISGVSNINFIPNPTWKEQLYKAQINYIEKDPRKTNFASQLTSQVQNSALSDISNVRALLRIRREVEKMMADYRMEFNDATTYDSMNYDLSNYLQRWVANRTCKTISGTVYASDYDRQQKKVNVKIELVFTGLIERVFIDIIVNR